MKNRLRTNVVKRRYSVVAINSETCKTETMVVFADSRENAIMQMPLKWDIITCDEIKEGGTDDGA